MGVVCQRKTSLYLQIIQVRKQTEIDNVINSFNRVLKNLAIKFTCSGIPIK